MVPFHSTILSQSPFPGSAFYHHPLTPNSLNVSSICLHPSTETIPSVSSESGSSVLLPVILMGPWSFPSLRAALPFLRTPLLWPSCSVWVGSHPSLRIPFPPWELLTSCGSSINNNCPSRSSPVTCQLLLKPDKMQIPRSPWSFWLSRSGEKSRKFHFISTQ